MKLRHPLLIRIVAAGLAWVVRAWLATCRVRMVSLDGRIHPADPKQSRYLHVFWHEGLLGLVAGKSSVQVLISQHADGELIAQVCRRLGFGVIRGSSTRGGGEAMLEMIRASDPHSHLIITPDGPRGPRRQMKVGPVMVASWSGLPIIPIGVAFTAAWRAGSWDQMAIPKPFSTLVGVFGAPIDVPGDVDRDGREAFVELVQTRLAQAQMLAEDWAARLRETPAAPPPTLNSTTPNHSKAA